MNAVRTIGAHWYSRPATLKECTEQSLDFLRKLKEHNPALFGIWFQLGGSKKQARQNKVEFTYDFVKRLFTKRGKDYTYPDVSYSFGIWNGAVKDEEAASLSISLGSTETKYFTNNCIISLPNEGLQHEFYKKKENQDGLIQLQKGHWNPEWIMMDQKRLEFK